MSDEKEIKLNETNNIYDVTTSSLIDLQDQFSYYRRCVNNFSEGLTSVELRKKFMLRVLDKDWIEMIEDTLPAIDAIIRNPGGSLDDFEEIKPIEQTRKVTSKSVEHLVQHTDYINEIRDDGMVIPSKLLNVYQDETLFTYENKFINTLIQRVYAFVMLRYDAACECGEDEKNTVFKFNQEFVEGERKGTINVSIDISEPPKDGELVKNYIYTTDLWRRLKKIVEWVKTLAASRFVKDMGKTFIHPPVMRTNKLLKNVNFRQSLDLWEFLETYENVGYQTLVKEAEENVEQSYIKNFANAVIAQYVLFQKAINNDFNPENILDERISDVFEAKVKQELDEFNEREYDLTDYVPNKAPELTEEEKMSFQENLEYALQVAMAVDDATFKEEVEEGILYRFSYSFMGRIILAQDPCQNYYTILKNKLLSYNTVASNVSWKHELFKSGKNKVCRMCVKGKTLCLYLPLDPTTYTDDKYKIFDLTGSKANGDLPFMIKIKNDKYKDYAVQLIEQIMIGLGLIVNPDYVGKDYHRAPKTPIQLCRMKPALAKLLNGELPEDPNKLEIKYNYSFLGRLCKSEDQCQDYYSTIKNKIMSYGKVEDTISWKHELFSYKRNKLALINAKGKTLYVYLPLDPNNYQEAKFKFDNLSTKKQFADTPMLLKIKNEKTLNACLGLIDEVMLQANMSLLKRTKKLKYYIPMHTFEELSQMNPPLAKLNGAKIETPVFNPSDYVVVPDKKAIIRHNYSFTGRLILVQEPAQTIYSDLKNELLSFNTVKCTTSWKHELYKVGRLKVAKLVMKGKTLSILLPLDPSNYVDSKYNIVDLREKKPDTDLPLLMKVNGPRKAKQAMELINDVMTNNNLTKLDNFETVDYHMPVMTLKELAESNPPLVKLGGPIDGEN